jgi:CTP synthase (UTP-ammonia lyase)
MIKVGIIGDYDGRLSHLATNSALKDSANYLEFTVEIEWVPTESLAETTNALEKFDILFGSPGSPYKNFQGAINGIRFARENKIPFLGTCGGFQHAVIEFAKNELGENSTDLIVPLICSLKGIETTIHLKENSKVYEIYQKNKIEEKFRCEYGLSKEVQNLLEKTNMKITGRDDNNQVTIVEIVDHPFFIGSLFQPQLSSKSGESHPLLNALLRASYFHYGSDPGHKLEN